MSGSHHIPLLWVCGFKTFEVGKRPLLMGILNITPDSFSDGGAYPDEASAMEAAGKMIAAGAHIIDVGGESTRPGASPVDADTESKRVLGVIRRIRTQWPDISISIDTYKASVAEQAIEAGANIINDVGGGLWDEAMIHLLKKYSTVGYICMHAQGRPPEMQKSPVYDDVVVDVVDFLKKRMACLVAEGIDARRIVLDVGIGFGKSAEHNMTLLRAAKTFATLQRPMLWGLSRKSFIRKLIGSTEENRDASGLVLHSWLRSQECPMIFRVHDVAMIRQMLDLWDHI